MLPKNLKYGSKVESAMARSYRSNIQPQNGTGPYNLGDTVMFNIPTRANLVMVPTESYLKFTLSTLTATAATAIRLDSCGAHGLIQRIRIFHGSNLLEDIDNYGLLAKLLFDIQVSTDACYGKFNMLCGTRNDLSLKYATITTNDAAGDVGAGALANALKAILNNTSFSANQTNSGELIKKSDGSNTLTYAAGPPVVADTTDTAFLNTYCLNLVSLIGSLCSNNYLPLFGMTSAPLRVEITLVDNIVKGLNTVTALALNTGLIKNVEFVGNFIELGDPAMSMVYESLQGQPLQLVFPEFRNFQDTRQVNNASTTQINFSIPAKFSSLKSIFVTIRDKGTGALTFFPYSSVRYGLSSYFFRIGSQIMPSKAPETVAEYFAELMKAIGSIADINHQPSIEKFSYSLQTSVANSVALEANGGSNVSSGSFYIALDLENYASASKDSIFAGWNSNTDDIYCVLNFDGSQAQTNLRFDAFANYDCVLVVDNNTAYIKM
jgi:hypothetical protein